MRAGGRTLFSEGRGTTIRMGVGAVKYERSERCQEAREKGKGKSQGLKAKAMFILVLDQNCRSNCTDQGLNREHLPVLAVV